MVECSDREVDTSSIKHRGNPCNSALDCTLIERGKSEEQSWRSWPDRVTRYRWHIQASKHQPVAADLIVEVAWEHACEIPASARDGETQWEAAARHLFKKVALPLGMVLPAASQVGIE